MYISKKHDKIFLDSIDSKHLNRSIPASVIFIMLRTMSIAMFFWGDEKDDNDDDNDNDDDYGDGDKDTKHSFPHKMSNAMFFWGSVPHFKDNGRAKDFKDKGRGN